MNTALFKVFFAIILAVVAGKLTGTSVGIAGVTFYQIYGLVGQLFLNALNLVVVPLVSASIITGTAKLGKEKSFADLGLKTFGYFLGTTFLAILVGWILVSLIEPGMGADQINKLSESRIHEITAQANEATFVKFEKIFLKIIPSNILAVASQGDMLGLIFFCLLFGFLLSKIDPETSHTLQNFFKGIFQVMMKITELVMWFLPIGVFALVAKAAATTGIEAFASVGLFFITVLLGLAIYMFILLPLLLKTVAQVSPIKHLKAMAPALVTAFSTTSSAATLPVTMECVEKKIGVSNRIASFTLPLATSVNLAGSALQVIVAVFAISQSYGVFLSFPTQCFVFLMTFCLSFGMAGIPSASLIAIVLILTSIGFPPDSIGLILAVERILDMFRTCVNVYSNSCCAVLVAKSEKEIIKI